MTNATVLNKTSNLVMPSYYVELDREEMSYVEGGWGIFGAIVGAVGGLVTSLIKGESVGKTFARIGVGAVAGALGGAAFYYIGGAVACAVPLSLSASIYVGGAVGFVSSQLVSNGLKQLAEWLLF